MREICTHGSERKSNSSVCYVQNLENEGGKKFTYDKECCVKKGVKK